MVRLIPVIMLFLLWGCESKYPGYRDMGSGLYFQLKTIEEGTKTIQPNNYIQFKYNFKDFSGEELDDSRILLKVNETTQKGGLVEALGLLKEKEIGEFIFPLGKLHEELDGAFIFDGIPDTTMLFAEIQIDSIYSEAEFVEARERFVDWVNEVDTRDFDVIKEEATLDQFEMENSIRTKKTPTGLRYFYIRKGTGEEAGYGKRVGLSYVGRFLNGEPFNTTRSLENGVQDFYVGQEMQVIKGIEEALLMMREGDVVMLLMPSWTAFGVEGSSTGVVPARTPVMYEVELKKVN